VAVVLVLADVLLFVAELFLVPPPQPASASEQATEAINKIRMKIPFSVRHFQVAGAGWLTWMKWRRQRVISPSATGLPGCSLPLP
jgi:hypothetical protein